SSTSQGSGSIYVADSGAGTVVVFGQQEPSVPQVSNESFSKVTSTSASLAAQINPRSEPTEAPSEYHFQYGRCATLDPESCKQSGYEVDAPVPDGQIPADFNPHAVSSELGGLQPHSTYHFRVVAKNSHGQG